MKYKIRIYFIAIIGILVLTSCQPDETKKLFKIGGNTMGTTYHISYKGDDNHKEAIDSILKEINHQVSTYIDSSAISIFNKQNDTFDLSLMLIDFPDTAKHFVSNYKIAWAIYNISHGSFDPTVMPLVNYWGFGYKKREIIPDSSSIDSIKLFVGMDLIKTDDYLVFEKLKKNVELDFSAVAKGYAVDEIADFLGDLNIQHYMVEIGGELKVKGNNATNDPWVIGINQPSEKSATNDVSMLIGITNCAIATSGNYRNYYMTDDQKFVHTVNPQSGYTEQNNLLSATIIDRSCARADALATACMVMGVEKAQKLIQKDGSLEACLIYSLESGIDSIWTTEGFNKMILTK